MSNVLVAVRVRPFNERERSNKSTCIIQMQGQSTVIRNPAIEGQAGLKPFSFDYSYWSVDDTNPENFADQERVFRDLGINILDNAFAGFNCSIFAYGQTGAGKSYSMLGYGEDKGLIPKVCEEMYRRIDHMKESNPEFGVNVEVSFMEIYNENVFDLLNPSNNKSGLKVRNHPTTGPYVEDLSKLAVNHYAQIEQLMEEGSKARTVASTNMNATSSRSHAVFTIVLTITKGGSRSVVSKIHMVDLAGSERATATGASGQRLKEGANINKSLSTLGKVIAALAKKSDGKKNVFIPYRDSVLTWLLKESLGGNSKTIMLAAISPADINFEETLSTLRYADSAKQIKNAAIVNEDPTEKLIRELQEEVERLKNLLAEKEKSSNISNNNDDGIENNPNLNNLSSESAPLPRSNSSIPKLSITSASSSDSNGINNLTMKSSQSTIVDDLSIGQDSSIDDIRSQIMQSTKLISTLGKSWETRLAETEQIRKERSVALEDAGLSSLVDSSLPNLVNLNEDPLLSGALVYYLRLGETHVGSSSQKRNITSNSTGKDGSESSGEIVKNNNVLLSGLGVGEEHCTIVNDGKDVWIHPKLEYSTYVNGVKLNAPRRLNHGCRVIFGTNHIFRFNHPSEAANQRRNDQDQESDNQLTSNQSSQTIDYRYALEERASAEVDALMANTLHFDLTSEEEIQLEKKMKEYYESKRKEMEEIDKQLEALRKNRDSALEAIDYDQTKQELTTKKVSIEMELAKQKEKFANFSFRIWTEKLERQQLREAITRILVLIDEANAISRELQKGTYYELHLRSTHPTHASNEDDQIDSGFGLFKRILVEARGIDLFDGRFSDWSYTAFYELVLEMRNIYSSYLTASDEDVDKFYGRIANQNQASSSLTSTAPISARGESSDLSMSSNNTSNNSNNQDFSNSPFNIPRLEDTVLLFSHVPMRELLYFNSMSVESPVMDLHGNVIGHVQVELDRIISEHNMTPPSAKNSSSKKESTSSNQGNINRPISPSSNVLHPETLRTAEFMLGREIEVIVRINKITGLDNNVVYPSLYCTYQFWNSSTFKTEAGSTSLLNDPNDSATPSSSSNSITVPSSSRSTSSKSNLSMTFFHEEKFVISEAREDFLSYLENESLVLEFWSSYSSESIDTSALSTSNSSIRSFGNNYLSKANLEALKKKVCPEDDTASDSSKSSQPQDFLHEKKEDKFKMLASIIIQEGFSGLSRGIEYKNVATKQEPWNTPSVLFRLRKNSKPPRKVIFQIAQIKDQPISIESCSKVTLSITKCSSSTSAMFLLASNKSAPDISSPSSNASDSTLISQQQHQEKQSSVPVNLTHSGSSHIRRGSASILMEPSSSNQDLFDSSNPNNSVTVELPVVSLNGDKVEVEWDGNLTESFLNLALPKSNNVPSAGTPSRRRGRSVANPSAPSNDELSFKPLSGNSAGDSKDSNLKTNTINSANPNSEEMSPTFVGQLEFEIKLSRLAVPIKLTKSFHMKFSGAERLKSLNRTVSEAQMIEDLNMKEILKGDEELLAMSGSHFQVNMIQYRTVSKMISAMIEEQLNIQKLVTATLVFQRLSNEIKLIEKLTSFTLSSVTPSIVDTNGNKTSVSSSSIGYPRSSQEVESKLAVVRTKLNELSTVSSSSIVKQQQKSSPSSPSNANNSKNTNNDPVDVSSDVEVQITTTDLNNRMESKVCGYLMKKSGKEWKPRWCVLSKMYFAVYRAEDDEHPKDSMDLTNARINDTRSSQYPLSFAIVNWQNVWFFQAQNLEDFSRWMDALDPSKSIREMQLAKEKTLQSKLESTSKSFKETTDQLKSTLRELSEANETIQKREEEIGQLTEEMEIMNSKLQQQQQQQQQHLSKEEDDVSSSPKPSTSDQNLSIVNKELQNQIAILEDENSDLKREANKKSKEIDRLNASLASSQQDYESTQNTLNELKSKIQSLENENSDLSATVSQKDRELSRKVKDVSSLQDQVEQLDRQVEKLTKDLKKSQQSQSSTDANISGSSSSSRLPSKSALDKVDREEKIELKATIKRLQEQLSDKENELSVLEREHQRAMKDSTEELKSKIDMKEMDITKLNRDLNKKTQEIAAKVRIIDDQMAELDDLGEQLDQLKKDSSSKDKALQEKQKEIERREREQYQMKQQFTKLQESHQRLVTEAQESQTALKQHQDGINAQDSIEQQKKDVAILKRENQIQKLQFEIEDLTKLNLQLKTEVKEKKSTINENQKEITRLKTQNSNKDRTIEEQTKNLTSLNESLADGERQLAESKRLVSSKSREITSLENEVESWKEKCDQEKRKTEDQKRNVEDKEAEISDLQADISQLQSDISQLERQLNESQQQVAQLDTCCFDLQSKLEDSKLELKTVLDNDEKPALIRDHKRTTNQLNQQIEELELNLRRADSQIDSLNQQLDKKDNKIRELETIVAKLNARLESTNASGSSNDAEKSQLQNQLKSSETQLKRLQEELDSANREIRKLNRRAERSLDGVAGAAASSDASSSITSSKTQSSTTDQPSESKSKLEKKHEDLQTKYDTLLKEFAKLEINLERKNAQVERLERDRQTQRELLQDLETSVKKSSSSYSSSDSSSGGTSRRRSNIATGAISQDDVNRMIDDALSDMRKEIRDMKRTYQKDLSEKNAEIEGLKVKVVSLTQQNSDLQSQQIGRKPSSRYGNSSLSSNSSFMNRSDEAWIELELKVEKSAESQRENEELREKILNLQKKLKERSSELEDLQNLNKRNENRSRRGEELNEVERNQFLKKIAELEAEKANLSERFNHRNPKQSSSSSSTGAGGKSYLAPEILDDVEIDWKYRCEQKDRELEQLRKEMRQGGSSRRLEAIEQKYPEIHHRSLKAQVDVLKETTSLQGYRIDRLRGSQKDMSSDNAQLKTEVEDYQSQSQDAARAAKDAARTSKRLQDQVDTLQSRIDELKAAERVLRKENDHLLDERIALVRAVKKAQIEVLAATGEKPDFGLPPSVV